MVIAKKNLKSRRKDKENHADYIIDNPEKPRLLDEFFQGIATIFENILIRMSLNYRHQQPVLAEALRECAYYMSRGGRRDKEHFSGASVVGSMGYYLTIESALYFLATRTSDSSYGLQEMIYFFPLLQEVHRSKMNYHQIIIGNFSTDFLE